MCGIVGVLARRWAGEVPAAGGLLADLDEALTATEPLDTDRLIAALVAVDRPLRSVGGVLAAQADPGLIPSVLERLDVVEAAVSRAEAEMESGASSLGEDETERIAAGLVTVHDLCWAIRHDRCALMMSVLELAGASATTSAVEAFVSIHQTLAAIDRLEVRGRDSAGVHIMVSGHGLDLDEHAETIRARATDPLFQSGAVRVVGDALSFVYKAAAEIGELGDNTRHIRSQIAGDPLLRLAVSTPTSFAAVLAHTRWASVGVISEPNAHPVNSEELESEGGQPYVVAALNGDVDNHADLRVRHGLRVHHQITTDAKPIPALVSRRLAEGHDAVEAFRRSVNEFDGSVAIAAMAAAEPTRMLLALRGSGQGLFVGIAEDRFIVASEPYGVVEETKRFIRVDGEHGGEVLSLDGGQAGRVEGISRWRYDGVEAPVGDDDVQIAEVTTRDIDRGAAPHFLLKEITEAPNSLRKTLRGRIARGDDGIARAVLGESSLPESVRSRLADGSIRRIRVIGQGTAAVAGQGAAALLEELGGGELDIVSITATEVSGFQMRPDMSDTLAIAVSQSGTTTDTNRTVDLLRARGAAVIGIVNRRNSDLVDKADGVVYTSDGRDVEMSVASTKAFYSQIAAGALLACAVTDAAGVGDDSRRHRLLEHLEGLPEALSRVLERRPAIAEAAQRLAPAKRYWAVVGNGPNRVAANEVRIKLSELCYKSIASDVTEDKKHIDLSSEPLIFVCAAGLDGSTADDVAKETAIFSAHKATAIVVADEGETRFHAPAVISVPRVDPSLGFVLSAMVGHLFGYEAARAIDDSARPLRLAREAIEQAVAEGGTGDEVIVRLRATLPVALADFDAGLRSGRYDGHLEASTAVRLTGLVANLLSDRPVEQFSAATGKVGTPGLLIDDVVAALTRAIEELTRPIDAIKHQAKTVTVGISRSDEEVLDRPLVQATLRAGAGRDVLAYRTLRVLAALDPAVASVAGYTRYGIDGEAISIIDRDGISRDLPSRVESEGLLKGTKHRVAENREVLVARGRRDDRIVILVPEVKGSTCTGITLLHVELHDRLPAPVARGVLQGYDQRYDRLVDWVTETEGAFDEDVLARIAVADLLIAPISETADHWMSN